MAIRGRLMKKIKALPEDRLKEVADFIELMESKEKGQSDLAEYGMQDYLPQLSVYEELLAAGKIRWK